MFIISVMLYQYQRIIGFEKGKLKFIRSSFFMVIDKIHINPSNAEATFIQRTRAQRF